MTSAWVRKEVRTALAEEREQSRTVLFPVRVDDAVMDTTEQWADDIRRTRHIGDFTCRKEHDAYQPRRPTNCCATSGSRRGLSRMPDEHPQTLALRRHGRPERHDRARRAGHPRSARRRRAAVPSPPSSRRWPVGTTAKDVLLTLIRLSVTGQVEETGGEVRAGAGRAVTGRHLRPFVRALTSYLPMPLAADLRAAHFSGQGKGKSPLARRPEFLIARERVRMRPIRVPAADLGQPGAEKDRARPLLGYGKGRPLRGGPGRIRSSILPGPRITTGSAPDKAHLGRKREGRPRGAASGSIREAKDGCWIGPAPAAVCALVLCHTLIVG